MLHLYCMKLFSKSLQSTSHLLLLLLGVLAMGFNSCGPKDCHEDGSCPPEYYRFKLGEGLNYLFAREGSYWIYKNTKTADLDTVICTYFRLDSIKQTGTINGRQNRTYHYDRLNRKLFSSFFKRYIYENTTSHNPDATTIDNGFYGLDREIGGLSIISAFHFPFNNVDISGNGAEVTRFVNLDSTVILNGKVYKNVAAFSISNDGTWEDTPPYTESIYYWAKDIGLIKRKSIQKNYSWELIEYNILN